MGCSLACFHLLSWCTSKLQILDPVGCKLIHNIFGHLKETIQLVKKLIG